MLQAWVVDARALAHCTPQAQTAIADYIRRVSTGLADAVVSITLYGSQARGDAETESDIDLFIVVRHNSQDVRAALADIAWQVQFEHGVLISDIVRTLSQLRLMQAHHFPYYQSIEREGILLWKSTSETMPASA